jgi:predicted O-methyltransferase YrrM
MFRDAIGLVGVKGVPTSMNKETWTAVDEYFKEKLIGIDDALDAALTNSEMSGLPAINVAPNQGKFLSMLAQIQCAKSILEIGTLGGYSTIWLTWGLADGGQLVSLEYDKNHADVAQQNIEHAGLADRVEIMQGAALDTLPSLISDSRAPFDIVFIDADKQNNPAYVNWAMKLTRPGSIIIVDNVVRNGTIAEAESNDPDVQGARALFDLIENEPKLDATALQTVGIKGYDGLVIALVTD